MPDQREQAFEYMRRGMSSLASGRADDAESAFRSALAIAPRLTPAAVQLGIALGLRGRSSESEHIFREVIRQNPDHVNGHIYLGDICRHTGRPVEAADCYRRAIELGCRAIDVYLYLMQVLDKSGQFDQAIEVGRELSASFPDDARGHIRLGQLYYRSGQYRPAYDSFHRAHRLEPGNVDVLIDMGSAMMARYQPVEAESLFRKALVLSPGHTKALCQLVITLRQQNRLDEAEDLCREAVRVHGLPGIQLYRATMVPLVYESQEAIQQWRRRVNRRVERLLIRPSKVDATGLTMDPSVFYLAYHGLNNRIIMQNIARLCRSMCPDLNDTSPHCCQNRESSVKGKRLAIGFISEYFRDHTIAKLSRGLIDRLSRNRFEVTAVSLSNRSDAVTRQIRESADHWMVLPDHLFQARQMLADRKFDILFYPDIGMSRLSRYLAFSRSAPLQCVTWGHPDTTGIDTIDYFISARDLEPADAQDYYSETLIQLEHMPTYYYRPSLDIPTPDRSRFGFDRNHPVYLCPQSLFKFHPDFDLVLAGILRRDRKGRVVIIDQNPRGLLDILRRRWLQTMPDVTDRIVALPRQRNDAFMHLMASCDVMLDTLHFGGGNTHFEAFSLGVPVITMPGRAMRSRVALACYRAMSVSDCIAGSIEEYIEKAVHLANDGNDRCRISHQIRERNHVLYENQAAVDELEAFLVSAFARSVIGRAA